MVGCRNIGIVDARLWEFMVDLECWVVVLLSKVLSSHLVEIVDDVDEDAEGSECFNSVGPSFH